ncbi:MULTISPECIES: DUF2384 domain-containing protein [Polaromonas]|uniref:DUF2384 domain-containing protein n=1 Tax=Polaromonas aquatica TaxID=332657 RepID=A0ABW1U115_9BURK
MSIATSPSSADALPEKSWVNFVADLQGPELAPMLSPVRYIDLLGMDIETLARNARVTVAAIAETPGAASIQMHLRENLRVIKAAHDVSGNDLLKTLRWFRAEPLPAFGRMTAEQAVAADRTDDVIRLILSLHGGAAG